MVNIAIEVKEKKSKKQKPADVLVNFILDESGSMGNATGDVIGSFRTYVEDTKKQEGETYISLTKFNNSSNIVYTDKPISEVPLLTTATYRPGGGTALYDAIGNTVRAIEGKIAGRKKQPRVLVVIFTDGQENSSREWRRDGINALVKQKEAEGNWTFVYLGATLEAHQAAEGLGFCPNNSYLYSTKNSMDTMSHLSSGTQRLRSSAVAHSANFLAPEEVANLNAPTPPVAAASKSPVTSK